MEVQGKIKSIGEILKFGAKDFRKMEVVVTTEEQYPQHIMIEFVQDKCDLLAIYKVGDSVKVGINLRGREWVNPEGISKYFNSLQGWRIDKATGQDNGQATGQAEKQFEPVNNLNDNSDDLPF